jgi:protein-disulfide isomerase
MERRQILIAGGTTLALLPAARGLFGVPRALADELPVRDGERILGQPEAPITIIEYSSLTCPHCASFHKDTLPTIKKNWIEPGKARLVYRDFPLDGLALRAAALAQCVEGEAYFGFLDALFRGQSRWARAKDPTAALAQLARLAGIDQKTFDGCISDKDVMDRLLKQKVEGTQAYDIESTPTFIINGRRVAGALKPQQFEKILAEAE